MDDIFSDLYMCMPHNVGIFHYAALAIDYHDW